MNCNVAGTKQWVSIGVDYLFESINVVFFYLHDIPLRNVAFQPTQIFLQIIIFKAIYYTDCTWCVECFCLQYSNSCVLYNNKALLTNSPLCWVVGY